MELTRAKLTLWGARTACRRSLHCDDYKFQFTSAMNSLDQIGGSGASLLFAVYGNQYAIHGDTHR